jgi:sugar phosphate isomerase/epimerase
MTIKLGCADFTWPLLAHEHVVELIKMLGFQGIDLGVFAGRSHIRPEVIRQDIPMWSGIIRERLDRAGLEVADVFLAPSLELAEFAVNSPDAHDQEESRAIFLDVLDFARRIGAPGITMNSGVVFDGDSPESSLRHSAEGLKWRVEQAARHGIQIRVEGAKAGRLNTDTPEKLLELVALTPGLRLTVDYCHFVYQGIPEARVKPLLDHAGHFQCRGAARGRMQVSFQENTIDYRRIIGRLKELDYAGYFSIEYVWTEIWDCNRTENTMETIQFRDLARAAIDDREYTPYREPI